MALRVGGLTRLTTIDFPGRLAAVVFCQGCPWRCGYCHNPELLDASQPGTLAWADVLGFLHQRRGLLDGVVFSGGEPLADPALPALLAEARALGFATGLHTAGAHPHRLQQVLPLLDWVGLDIKTLPSHYAALTGSGGSGARAFASLELLLAHGGNFECRSTIHPALHDETTLRQLAATLAGHGVRHYAWQLLRPGPQLPQPFAPIAAGWPQAGLQQQVVAMFERFELRTG